MPVICLPATLKCPVDLVHNSEARFRVNEKPRLKERTYNDMDHFLCLFERLMQRFKLGPHTYEAFVDVEIRILC